MLELVNVFQTAHERALAFQLIRDETKRRSLELPFLSNNIPKATVQAISSLILDCTDIDPLKRPNAKSLNYYVKFIQNNLASHCTTNTTTSTTTSLTTYNSNTDMVPIEYYNRANSLNSTFDAEVNMLKGELQRSQSEVEIQKKQLEEKDLLILELQQQVQRLKPT